MNETLSPLVQNTGGYSAPPQITINGPYYTPEREAAMYSEWSDGLFDCCSDLGTCLLCCCYPVGSALLVYLVMERLPATYRKQAAILGIDIFAEPILAACFFLFVGCDTWIIATYMIYVLQRAVADRYKIEDPGSLFRSCCCSCCLLAQLARQTGRAQGFIR